MRCCNKCKIDKDIIEFSKNQYECKSCNKERRKGNELKAKEYAKKYYLVKKEEIINQKREYRARSQDKINQWRTNNKDKINKYQNEKAKKRRQTDSLFKLTTNIRNLICLYIKNRGYSKTSKTQDILGCDFETFKLHLEKQFTKGMNWSNQGEWHLDHIYPVSLARNEKHIIELNHYTNFQPLWAKDNLSKGNNIIEKQLFLI